jgi:sugar phosphate isomerase/epimerase
LVDRGDYAAYHGHSKIEAVFAHLKHLRGLKARSAAAGLRPICLQGSRFGGAGSRGIMNDVGHKLVYGAREPGCRRIKCTGSARAQGGLKSVIEVCKELAPAAEELDVVILLGNHDRSVLETIADYEEVFAAVDSPRIGMCLDTDHFERIGVSLREVAEKFHSRVLQVDLKDCKERGAGHNTVMFGEGVTDFNGFLQHLLSGYLVIEMAWPEPREPVVANLRNARELFLRDDRV